jgi:hypothetical protein
VIRLDTLKNSEETTVDQATSVVRGVVSYLIKEIKAASGEAHAVANAVGHRLFVYAAPRLAKALLDAGFTPVNAHRSRTALGRQLARPCVEWSLNLQFTEAWHIREESADALRVDVPDEYVFERGHMTGSALLAY